MAQYTIVLIIIGLSIMAMAWMPALTEKIRLSYSVIYVAAGALLYSILPNSPAPVPMQYPLFTLRLTELVVIISLMGTGLKIDQKFSVKGWRVPLRLASVTMLLSIGGMMLLCIWLLDFPPAVALLIGAVLAPTDPVLATDVQVEAPNEGKPDNVKFSLTAEAGFNDGSAFPLVWLAITLSGLGNTDFGYWVWYHVLYQVGAGLLCGYLLGKLVAFLIFDLPKKKEYLMTSDGFVSIAATLLVYGATELVHGYGFVAVFVAGLAIRNYERKHKFHKRLHEFSDQMERILVAIMLILFGGSLVSGILNQLTWAMALCGLLFIFVVRPLVTYLSLAGSGLHHKEKLVIGFFGIRGVGSAYYLAFALGIAQFGNEERLWSLVAFVVLISIIIHGSTASIFLQKLERDLPRNTTIIAK